jgi:GGDEF domain-containing protein
VDYHQLLRDSLTRLPTVAATIDSIRKAVQDRGEVVVLYFNFDRYSKVEEVYGWEKLDSVLETTGQAMRDFLAKSPLAASKLMVAFPNDDDFVFFHVPQEDTPAATDAEITELTLGLKDRVSSEIERVHGEDIAAFAKLPTPPRASSTASRPRSSATCGKRCGTGVSTSNTIRSSSPTPRKSSATKRWRAAPCGACEARK